MALVKDDDNGGLVTRSPSQPISKPVQTVTVTTTEDISIATDTKWKSRKSLITHVEGSSWVVQYFSQVLNTNSQLSSHQASVTRTNDQYTKINNLNLKVSSPLTTSQDTETNEMVVEGEAILPPLIIPNSGDMFIADIGEGELGLFSISTTEKLSIFREACYRIKYSLSDSSEQKRNNINSKVVKETYFQGDLVALGKDPLIVDSDYWAITELIRELSRVTEQYFKRFYSKEFKTLLLPAQDSKVYDHYLVDFVLSQFTTKDSQEMVHLLKYNVLNHNNLECDSIWTAIAKRDNIYFETAFKKAGLVSINCFNNYPYANSVRYSGVDRLVYPIDPVFTVDDTLQDSSKPLSLIEVQQPNSNGRFGEMIQAINLAALDATQEQKRLPLVTADDYYVLTEKFYKNLDTMSVFEGMVKSYIERTALDKSQLLNITKTFTKWGLLEQFYYLPIVMVMVKSIVNGE